jgi:hypothetical protein
MSDGPRRFGSSVIGLAMGAALIALGLYTWFGDPAFFSRNALTSHGNEKFVDVFSCLLFGVVLIWWSVLGEIFKYSLYSQWRARTPWKVPAEWALGNPTITMVVGVVTAIIAIFTLVHDVNKPEPNPRPQTIITNQFDSPSNLGATPPRAASRGLTQKKGSGNPGNQPK